MKVLTIHDDGTVEEVDLDNIGSFRPSFTPRERQVLDALAEGKRNEAIAADLGLAPKTVKVHVREVLGKLDAKNRTHAVTAIHRGGFGHAAAVANMKLPPSAAGEGQPRSLQARESHLGPGRLYPLRRYDQGGIKPSLPW